MNNPSHLNQPITELGTLQLCSDWLRTFIGQIWLFLGVFLMAISLCVCLYLTDKLLETRDELITLSHPE